MILLEIGIDFSKVGPEAWTVFIVGWVVVFVSLIILSFLFRMVPNILGISKKHKEFVAKRKAAKLLKLNGEELKKVDSWDDMITGELTAAIGYALHLYFSDLHDEENSTLTVVHKSRKYSPWSSKIYNVMDFRR